MSVYIKGMEMPKSCFECKLLDYTDTYKCRVRFESLAREHGINISRPDWCPLIPVPDHGRLIDADALVHSYYHAPSFHNLCKAINDAPTIIPADHIGDANEMVADKEGEG